MATDGWQLVRKFKADLMETLRERESGVRPLQPKAQDTSRQTATRASQERRSS